MKPKFITFTGFDDRTKLSDMWEISKEYPVEWGVLTSPTNQTSRFPSKEAIEELCAVSSQSEKMRLALHCCGSFSKGIQFEALPNIPIRSFDDFQRMQLNGEIFIPKHKLVLIAKKYNSWVIIQTKEFSNYGIFQLFDTSGGRGITPSELPGHPGYFVGYAGGISPSNVIDYINRINAPEGAKYWIDMESGVRTNGWFDLDKVISVCVKVYG